MAERARWMDVVGQKPKALDSKEIFNDREATMHFSAVAEDFINAGPYAGVGPASPAQIAQYETLRTAVAKLDAHAHRPDDQQDTPLQFSPEEQAALVPVFGRFQRGREAKASVEKYFKDEEVMVVLDWASKQPIDFQLTGLLAMPGSRADEFFPMALKTLAHIDPNGFRETVDFLAQARNFARDDAKVLSSVRALGERYGFDERTMLDALSNDDWEEQIRGMIATRNEGRSWSLAAEWKDLVTRGNLFRLREGVQRYRAHDARRQELLGGISDRMTQLINTPGVVNTTFEQMAFRPKADSEAKQSFDTVQEVKKKVNEMLGDEGKLGQSIQDRLSGHRLWRYRNDPVRGEAARNMMARDLLDGEYREGIQAANSEKGGGFFAAVWEFLTSFLGTAYGASEVRKVADRIGKV